MITLYIFGPAFGLPDPSPFVTKIEVLLKMTGLAYRTDITGVEIVLFHLGDLLEKILEQQIEVLSRHQIPTPLATAPPFTPRMRLSTSPLFFSKRSKSAFVPLPE